MDADDELIINFVSYCSCDRSVESDVRCGRVGCSLGYLVVLVWLGQYYALLKDIRVSEGKAYQNFVGRMNANYQ